MKKKKLIPNAMNGKVFNSMSDLGAALGIKAHEPPTPRDKKCRKCGAVMQQLPGTNVWLCPGTTDDGKPCGNRALTSVQNRTTTYAEARI